MPPFWPYAVTAIGYRAVLEPDYVNTTVSLDPARERSNANLLRTAGPGRPKHSPNRVSKLVRESMAAAIESGEKKHPAMILLDLANDLKQPAHVRRRAAADLLPYLLPIKHSIELDSGDPEEMEQAQLRERTLLAEWTPNASNRP